MINSLRTSSWFLRRHRWDLLVFWTITGVVAAAYVMIASFKTLAFLRQVEVVSLVLFLGRVILSESGFGTVAGWRTQPLTKAQLITAHAVTVLLGLTPFFLLKWLLWQSHGPGDWLPVRSWIRFLAILVLGCGLLLVLCPWWSQASLLSRKRRSWSLIFVSLIVAGTHSEWISGGSNVPLSQRSSRSGGLSVDLSPLQHLGGNRSMWLCADSDGNTFIEATDERVIRLPLPISKPTVQDKVILQARNLRMVDGETIFTLDLHWKNDESNWASQVIGADQAIAIMLEYHTGHFSAPNWYRYHSSNRWLNLLPIVGASYELSFPSPAMLPENHLSHDELLNGLQLWIANDGEKADLDDEPPHDWTKTEETIIAECVRLNWELADPGSKTQPYSKALEDLGSSAVPTILAHGPWSARAWNLWAFPFLWEYAEKSHLPAVLAALEIDPLMGELCLRKNWHEEAMPILLDHLHAGRPLSDEILLALIQKKDPANAEALTKQFLRLEQESDDVARALPQHPGVDWEAVKVEAWKRAKHGYLNSSLAESWGAHAGDKEALRRLIVRGLAAETEEEQSLVTRRLGYLGSQYSIDELHRAWPHMAYTEKSWRMP